MGIIRAQRARRHALPDAVRTRFCQQPPRHKRQRLRRGTIKPLGIIDNNEQRKLSSDFRQQAERCQSNQKPVRRAARAQAERDPKRVALRARQPLQTIEHRPAQLVKRRERQLHLRFHTSARTTRNPEADSIA
jgi:hypothetical protein